MSNVREVGEFAAIGREIGELVEQKNAAYGHAFQNSAEQMKLYYPNGVQPHQYVDFCLTWIICNKLFRIANKKDAFGESPYGDITGYGILGKWNDNNSPAAEVRVPVGGEPDNKHFIKVVHVDPELEALLDRVRIDPDRFPATVSQ